METFLLDNILQQITVMRNMDKQPTKLRCDIDSWHVLVDELIPQMPTRIPAGPLKIYGLDVEISNIPNFEVV